MKCRHCATFLEDTFLDLGFAPPSNAYLTEDKLCLPEKYFPLKINVCGNCWLVQTEDYTQADELFSPDYAYFSSTSTSWLAHAKHYTEVIIDRLGLSEDSHVIEVASNDGYLLKNFLAAGIPCLGIEPTASTAAAAEYLHIPVLREFFSEALGKKLALNGKQADLIIGNNVYAHVPNINDFTLGLKSVLKPGGTITLEFPHLMQMIDHNQFDTVYHEHFSYLSLHTVKRIFETAGLRLWDVEQLSTHGGSLRVFGCHAADTRQTTPRVQALHGKELRRGLQCMDIYKSFQAQANRVKDDLLDFLIEQKRAGKKVAAYGAAAKGNTLLNYAGIKSDLLPAVCDAATAKQGKYMPGSHIPIVAPHQLKNRKLDYLLILPWNISTEIITQNMDLKRRGVKFVTAVPDLKIL
jgi:SAM-dependent methyltransferase